MRRLAIAAVGLALMVGFAGSACGGGQEGPPEVSPQGPRATIPAEVPPTEEARLRRLTLEPADLPPGFELEREAIAEAGNSIHYVAHYRNGQVFSEGSVEAGAPATIDVFVLLFNDDASSTALFATLQSSSTDALAQYTQVLRPWSEEYPGSQLRGVQTARLPVEGLVQDLGDESVAWQVFETIRFPGADTDTKFADVTTCIRRGRAVAMIDMGMVDEPPPTADVEGVVAKLDGRLGEALQ